MRNQIGGVLILRMECSFATSPDSLSVVLKSLYTCFQIGIDRKASSTGRWAALEGMSDLFQVGENIRARSCDFLLGESSIPPIDAYKPRNT